MPPSGKAVLKTFSADHETGNLTEYGGSSLLSGTLTVVSSPKGYGGGKCLRASVTEPDGYARGHAVASQTGWEIGEQVRWGGAFYVPKGFFAAKQGQIDIFRWDNFEQDEVTTERGGLVFHAEGAQIRLVRIKEGTPDEQVTLVLGPAISEERWYWAEVRQILWHEDGLAVSEFWLNGVKVGSSTNRNCTRADLKVSRHRVGIAATNGLQTNDITLYVDRIRSGPMPLVGPLRADTPPLSRRNRIVNP